jgi:menaquinone-dependent protoporphyrinogen oxidase
MEGRLVMPGVLVAYATKHGSTREVAEAVSKILRAEGVQVDLRPARGVRGPIGDRDLVVLGAPIYSGRWHRDAHRFLKRHRKELLTVPVAVFGMGPRNPGQEAWQRSRRQLDRALAKRDWLRPAAVAVFGGADPPTRHGKRRRDLRDWDAVRAWATSIGHDRVQAPPGAGAAAGP